MIFIHLFSLNDVFLHKIIVFMYDYHIAIIDDNKAVLQSLKLVLEGVFRSVTVMTLPNALPAILAAGKVDAVLLDMNFSAQKLDGQEGLTWLRYIKQQENPPAVVMITAFGDINLAVNSLKEGAEDFITKPWDNDELVEKLLNAIDQCHQKQDVTQKASEAEILKEENERKRQMTLDEAEKRHIQEMIAECGNNLTEVAKRLDIGRQKLYNKMKKYGLVV